MTSFDLAKWLRPHLPHTNRGLTITSVESLSDHTWTLVVEDPEDSDNELGLTAIWQPFGSEGSYELIIATRVRNIAPTGHEEWLTWEIRALDRANNLFGLKNRLGGQGSDGMLGAETLVRLRLEPRQVHLLVDQDPDRMERFLRNFEKAVVQVATDGLKLRRLRGQAPTLSRRARCN